jgi:hypothetical protein
MVSALITLLVICLIAGLIYYVLDAIPVPEPINRFAKIAVVVIAALAIILMLARLAGYDTGFPVR